MKPTTVLTYFVIMLLLVGALGGRGGRGGRGSRGGRRSWGGRGSRGGRRSWGRWGRGFGLGNLNTRLSELEDSFESLLGNFTALQEQLAGLETSSDSCLDCCLPKGCDNRWYKIYEHDENDMPIAGSKADLIEAVRNGASVRVWDQQDNYVTSLQNHKIIGTNLCGQALFHISTSDYETFQDDAFWRLVTPCTSGHRQIARYSVEEYASRGVTREKRPMTWFVRDASVEGPILSVTSSGTVTDGSVERVVEAVKNAEDVRIFINNLFSYPVENLEYNAAEDLVTAMGIWEISQSTRTRDGISVAEFRGTSDYSFFTLRSTDAENEASRWRFGSHIKLTHSTGSVPQVWFSDYCWKQVYKHYDNGAIISGSLEALIDAVEAGHRVKVVYQRKSLEADEILIRNGQVCVSLLNDLSKSAINDFPSDVEWCWTIACTTGSVKTIKYEVWDNDFVESFEINETLTWFIDQRQWKHVLSVNDTGMVQSGTKEELVAAIQNGADVRYRILADNTEAGFSIWQGADNLNMSADGVDVAAMHVRSISVELDGDSEVNFLSDPYWCFIIVTTQGKEEKSNWSVGEHTSRGHNSTQRWIDWFISE